ncbi:MAG: hypothetical protein A2Y10_08375 [Planctomycetes bacterium GWF2_41_51]|nr:MAG: hypothetical protein A2Y10_08375 [Planctomycetes bacterium GWF2_41_51]
MKDIEKYLSKEDKVILEDYISFCSQNAKGDKLEQRRRYAVQFRDIAEIPFNEFKDPKIIQHIVSIIKNADREIGGKNECIKQLKFFLNWLFDDANLIKKIRTIPQPNGYNTKKLNPNTLATEEEQAALIRGAESLKHKAMVMLLLECGMRPHELLALKWENIKFGEDKGDIQIFSTKTNGTRVLPFKTSYIPLMRWMNEFEYQERKQGDYVFPSPKSRNKPIYRSYIATLFRKICRQQKLRNITPYLIRHTKLTLMNKVLPEKVAAKYGGHSVQTSARYTHLNDDDIKAIVLDKIYNVKEPTVEEGRLMEKEMIKMQKIITEYKNRLVKLEEKNTQRNQADEIINLLTKNPESLKLIAQALSKSGLVNDFMKI